jgi:hypothetical protein
VATAVDFALEMRKEQGEYTLAGRTPNTVGQAMEAYALTNIRCECKGGGRGGERSAQGGGGRALTHVMVAVSS